MRQGFPPKLTFDQYKEAVRCHRIRTDTPTLSDLARQWGIGEQTVINALNRGVKAYDIRMHNESLATKEVTSAGETYE